jgi:hypothetical protein
MLRRSPVRFAAGVACVAVFTAAFAVDGSLVGKIVPPYPAGLDELQGACIPGGPSHDQLCDFGLVVIGKRASDPDREAISLQLLATRDAEPGAANARWRVVDAVAVPKARKGYWLQIGSCRIDRVDGPGVVVMATASTRAMFAGRGGTTSPAASWWRSIASGWTASTRDSASSCRYPVFYRAVCV